MKKRMIITGFLCVFVLILLDFIPIKYAVNDNKNKMVFITQPKLGDAEWTEIEYHNGKYDYNSINSARKGYHIDGKAPDRVLSKIDFDKVDLYLMKGDNKNKFLIYYEGKKLVKNDNTFPVYRIVADGWDILCPIHRASFRRYYASKKYLTVYDFDWIELIKGIFCQEDGLD